LAWLLDVNCLIALIDPQHVHHEIAHRWFAAREPRNWATCPLTENGVIRVLAQPTYPGGQQPPATTIGILREWKASDAAFHETWHDDVSLTDPQLFRPEYLVAPGQITDAYLLGLAARHGGRFVSFDLRLPWEAVQGGASDLVCHPEAAASSVSGPQ
jgi:toxin-antitoxin system PIN domain toxin